MKWISLLIILILGACTIDGEKKIDRSKITFKTGSDTQLFFKNVRQSYYDIEENEAAKFNVYRLSKRSLDESKPIFNLAIVNNFLNDEAYLLLEPNTATPDLPFEVISTNDSTNTSRVIRLQAQNRETTANFAADIYEDIQLGSKFTLKLGDSTRAILDNQQEREAFRITVADYLRLIRVF